MIRLGFHIPIAGGWKRTLAGAIRRRCSTCQVFTSAPVQWARHHLDAAQAAWFAAALKAHDIQPLFVHAPYLLNVASPAASLRRKSMRCLADELRRAALLQAAGVVLHLGSVGPRGRISAGLKRVARTLDEALERSESPCPLILENSAGQGNSIGRSIEQIRDIIGCSRYPRMLQACLDTAHAFAAGYPIHTPEGLEELLAEIDRQLGGGRLVLIHANDTIAPLGSRRDRHWHIGQGNIGTAAFKRLVNHPRLDGLPFIMETPGTEEDDRRNMRVMRRLVERKRRPPLPRAQ